MSDLDQRVLSSLERHLLTEVMFEAAAAAYREKFARAQGNRGAMRARLEAELADATRNSDRLLRLVEDGYADPAVAGPRLDELARKTRDLTGELA